MSRKIVGDDGDRPEGIRSPPATLVLASGSVTRAEILAHAGVKCVVDAAHLDEARIKSRCRAQGDEAAAAALLLAEAKAAAVAPRHPGVLVLGADQLLVCDGAWLDKPETLAEARATLVALRGRAHRLVSALAIVRDASVLWRHVEEAKLQMRAYSDRFIDAYLQAAGDEALGVVGACRLEGMGAQAFARVEGDAFAILGLPLLPLLDFLRGQGMLVD